MDERIDTILQGLLDMRGENRNTIIEGARRLFAEGAGPITSHHAGPKRPRQGTEARLTASTAASRAHQRGCQGRRRRSALRRTSATPWGSSAEATKAARNRVYRATPWPLQWQV